MFLLLYLEEGAEFDVDDIVSGLAVSGRSFALAGRAPFTIRYEYRVLDDVTTIELNDDAKSIVVDGMGPASLAAAIDLQRMSGLAFRIADDNYTFDLALSGFASPQALYEAMIRAGA